MPTLVNTCAAQVQPKALFPWIQGYTMTLSKAESPGLPPISKVEEQVSVPEIPTEPLHTDIKNAEAPKEKKRTLTNRGKIQSIELPINWVGAIGSDVVGDRFTPPSDSDIQFQIQSSCSMTAESAQTLRTLLACKTAKTTREVLLPGEIRSLSQVIGACSPVNDNQFAANAVSPSFHIFEASTISVGGETVLYIEGKMDLNGVETAYTSIFFAGNESDSALQEVRLQAPAAKSFQYRKAFKNVIASINWSDH